MGTAITLPPTSRYLGRRVTATWHTGATITGVLAGADGSALTIREGHASTPIPYSAIASLHEAPADPVAADTSDARTERLNDIRDQLMKKARELPDVTSTYVHPAAAGVFGMDLADGGKVLVDLWHA